jgi:hypothetical protein
VPLPLSRDLQRVVILDRRFVGPVFYLRGMGLAIGGGLLALLIYGLATTVRI